MRILVENLAKPRTASSLAQLLYAFGPIILILAAVSIVWHLTTTEFPTHSDVFWIGVQFGAFGVLSIIFFASGLPISYCKTLKNGRIELRFNAGGSLPILGNAPAK